MACRNAHLMAVCGCCKMDFTGVGGCAQMELASGGGLGRPSLLGVVGQCRQFFLSSGFAIIPFV